MKNHILILAIVLLSACGRNKDATHTDFSSFDKAAYFKNTFLKKFKPATLPLIMIPSGDFPSRETPFTDYTSADSLFIHQDQNIKCFVMLPDTTTYYGLIWLSPGDMFLPMLSTFDKQGNRIDEKNISLGYCGTDCGFECSETININADLTIFSIDSLSITKCDTLGNIIKGTTEKTVVSKQGSVKKNGSIEISEEKREKIRDSK